MSLLGTNPHPHPEPSAALSAQGEAGRSGPCALVSVILSSLPSTTERLSCQCEK